LHRATFAKSLAIHIIDNHYTDYELWEMNYIRGNKLQPGEKSRALYGVIGTKKDSVLRVPIQMETAKIYTEDDSRHIEEIFIDASKKKLLYSVS
jgi:hypothetical protein